MRVAPLPNPIQRTSPKPGVRSREAIRISFFKWVGTPTPLVGAWLHFAVAVCELHQAPIEVELAGWRVVTCSFDLINFEYFE
jgi:hypothetical protein